MPARDHGWPECVFGLHVFGFPPTRPAATALQARGICSSFGLEENLEDMWKKTGEKTGEKPWKKTWQ
jgi:hypothetical protein